MQRRRPAQYGLEKQLDGIAEGGSGQGREWRGIAFGRVCGASALDDAEVLAVGTGGQAMLEDIRQQSLGRAHLLEVGDGVSDELDGADEAEAAAWAIMAWMA